MKNRFRFVNIGLLLALVASLWLPFAGLASADDGEHEQEIRGIVQSIPAGRIGMWSVSGQNVQVTAYTRIKEEHGAITVGTQVKVKGNRQANGSFLAQKIERDENDGGEHHTHLTGTIQSMPAGRVGDWQVSGQVVHVATNTWINEEHGQAVAGATVEVKGYQRADGSWDAYEIDVQAGSGGGDPANDDFYGTVQSLPAGRVGTWVVSGRNVQVTASTRINEEHGQVVAGATVEVKGTRQADGSTLATEIDVQAVGGNPVPTPIPVPTINGTVVHLDSTQSHGVVNRAMNIDLKVTNVSDMGGFEMAIQFDPAKVQVQNVTMGDFLRSTGRTTSPLGPTVDNTAGQITLGTFSFGSQAGPSGEGTLATLVLMPLAQGNTALTLSNLKVTDSAGNSIDATAQDEQISIGSTSLNGDLNGDCKVDVVDVMHVASRWGSQTGENEYDDADDFDQNGEIDVVDVMQVAGHWGENCTDNGFAATGIKRNADAATAASPVLSLIAPQAVRAGKTFVARVHVADPGNLGGFEFRLTFDPTLLEVQNVKLSDRFSGGDNTCQILNKVDNQSGTLRTGGFCFGNQAGMQSDGNLAEITFVARAAGNTDLRVANVKATTMNGQKLQATASDAAIQLEEDAPVKVGPRLPVEVPSKAKIHPRKTDKAPSKAQTGPRRPANAPTQMNR